MTWTAVGSVIPIDATTFTYAPTAVGQVFFAAVVTESATDYASSITSSNATWTEIARFKGTTTAYYVTWFQGKSTASGSAVATVTFNAGTPVMRGAGRNYSSSAGSWSLAALSNFDSAGTATWPSATGSGLYLGFAFNGNIAVNGSTPGYVYGQDSNGNGFAYDLSYTSGAAGPTWGDSTQQFGLMLVVAEQSPVTVALPAAQVTVAAPALSPPGAVTVALPAAQVTVAAPSLNLPVAVLPPLPVSLPSLPPRQPWRFLFGPRAPGGLLSGAVEQASARRLTLRAEPDQDSQASWEMDGRDPAAASITELETDVTVMYGSQYVFAGRVGASQDAIDAASHRTQFTASDYRDVLRRQLLLPGDTLTYTNTEQQQIAWGLIQSAQAHAGGNLGIVQGLGQGGSGVHRTMTFAAGDYAGDDISTMAALANGFEWLIQPYGPGDLRFDFYYPQIGKSAGRVFSLGMSRVQSITRVVDPSTYADSVYVTGDSSVTPALTAQTLAAPGIASSPQGRWDQVIGSTMKTQTSLNDYAAQALAAAQVLVPTYTIVLQPGSWMGPDDVWLGDTVRVRVQSGRLNVDDNLRVVEMDFSIDANNLEILTLTVGAIPLQVWRLIPRMLKNLALLNTR